MRQDRAETSKKPFQVSVEAVWSDKNTKWLSSDQGCTLNLAVGDYNIQHSDLCFTQLIVLNKLFSSCSEAALPKIS